MSKNRPHEIAVFGASGYTGSQIVRELVNTGHDVLCVGRDYGQLQALTARHNWPVRIEAADLADHGRLKSLCAQVITVVNAAGSLSETCGPIASAAIDAGSHYIDISGEQQSLRFAFDALSEPATAAGVAVVPSAAFYAGLADIVTAVMAADLDHVESIDIAYHITNWIPSGAVYANFLRGMGQPIIQFNRGFIDIAKPAYQTIDFGYPLGQLRAFTYPAPDVLTIPRHVDVDRVSTAISASTFKTAVPDRMVPTATKAIGKALAGPAAPVIEKALGTLTGSTRVRVHDDPTTFRITIRLVAKSTVRTAMIEGRGIFDVTAPIVAKVAELTLFDTFNRSGTLAPAQVIADPRLFLAALAEHGVTYSISDGERIPTCSPPA